MKKKWLAILLAGILTLPGIGSAMISAEEILGDGDVAAESISVDELAGGDQVLLFEGTDIIPEEKEAEAPVIEEEVSGDAAEVSAEEPAVLTAIEELMALDTDELLMRGDHEEVIELPEGSELEDAYSVEATQYDTDCSKGWAALRTAINNGKTSMVSGSTTVTISYNGSYYFRYVYQSGTTTYTADMTLNYMHDGAARINMNLREGSGSRYATGYATIPNVRTHKSSTTLGVGVTSSNVTNGVSSLQSFAKTALKGWNNLFVSATNKQYDFRDLSFHSYFSTGTVNAEHLYTVYYTKNPTTSAAGYVQYKCSICGNYRTVVLPKLPSSNSVPMYRLYNMNSGEHFYTANATEKKGLVEKGWRDEGIGWFAPKSGGSPIIYRLYNPRRGFEEHHYTKDTNEINVLSRQGWKVEGPAWASAKSSGIPVYRLFNKRAANSASSHHYTTDLNERNTLTRQNWRYEGIAWYGVR